MVRIALTLIATFFLTDAQAASKSLKLADLKIVFAEKKLNKYIDSGRTVVNYFENVFQKVTKPEELDGGFAAEYFDLEYQVNLRPNTNEPYVTIDELTRDTNALLKLHRRYYSQIRNKVFLRNYFQIAFIGLVHSIESIKRVQVGLPQDGYQVLSRLILDQGRLISSDQKSIVTMTDFWWDYMWAYFLEYPIDIVELGNQKLRSVWLNEDREVYKKQIEKFLASYSLLGLRKSNPPLIYRDINNQLGLRLAKNATEIYSLRDDAKALSKARIYRYKFETKNGLSEEAEKTKREIARTGLSQRFKKIFSDPLQKAQAESNWIQKLATFIMGFLYSIYSLIRYSVGFLLITFPFDAAFIFAGLVVLSIEGRVQLKKELWDLPSYMPAKKDKFKLMKRTVYKIKSVIARLANDLSFSVQMLVHYYTNESTSRNVRIGSSLLIFGLGLFFSSARSMVESFVAQMAL